MIAIYYRRRINEGCGVFTLTFETYEMDPDNQEEREIVVNSGWYLGSKAWVDQSLNQLRA